MIKLWRVVRSSAQGHKDCKNSNQRYIDLFDAHGWMVCSSLIIETLVGTSYRRIAHKPILSQVLFYLILCTNHCDLARIYLTHFLQNGISPVRCSARCQKGFAGMPRAIFFKGCSCVQIWPWTREIDGIC
jgi:hypothetical protein